MPELKESLGGKFKFVFWVGGVLIFILSISGFFLVKTQSSLFKKEIEQRGKLLVEFVSKVVETPALYGDQVELERIVKEITKGKEEIIDYMVIFDNEGKPLTFSSKKPKKIDPKRTFVISTPILEDFGYVEIGYSLVPLQKIQTYLIFNILITIVLSILFSAAGIIFISRQLIIQPASTIIRELEEKVKERTRELEEERASLEIKVQARTRELKELAESLEEKVKERTRELEKRIAELEKFHKITVGRELKMIELKKKIKELEEELKKYKKS